MSDRFRRWVSKLTQGVFQALCGFLQLALEGVVLFRNIIEFFFRQGAGFRHFLNSAIRFAHGAPNSYRNLSELTFFGHAGPPVRMEASYTRTIPGVTNRTRVAAGLLPTHGLLHNFRQARPWRRLLREYWGNSNEAFPEFTFPIFTSLPVQAGCCPRAVESPEPGAGRAARVRWSAVDAAKRSDEAASALRLHHSGTLLADNSVSIAPRIPGD